MKPSANLCPACLLSAGAATMPVQPVSSGITTLPCVFGGYQLIKKLGAGGMGIVYEAEELASGRRIALKVLNQILDTEEQRQRFLREGRLAATIDHPRSVYVFGTAEIEGVPVIAMELAEGGTLRDEFKRRGPLPVRDAVDAILGVLDGLEAAHAKGILHRDMKPSNCFVTGDGKTIVGDYGLSISQNNPAGDDRQITRSGMIMGTPAFSPPEQLRGQSLDQRADLYSTAGTLYYLLTGKAPVEAGSPVETVAAVLEGRITPLAKLRADVPPDLSAVVMRCLSADAAKRPATHAEMRQALISFSSIAPEPAPLGMRFLAGLFDGVILSSLLGGLSMIGDAWSLSSFSDYQRYAIVFVLGLLYYVMQECAWGATPGKMLCGLRVQRVHGGRPGARAAASRVGICFAVPMVAVWLVEPFLPLEQALRDQTSGLFLGLTALLLILDQAHLLLFIPAWKRRDRAAWHDQLTGLRVVRKAAPIVRKMLPKSRPVAELTNQERWGPFVPGAVISPEWRHGYDPVLKRPVLLQCRCGSGPSAQRRDCNRGGRLRWQQSVPDAAGAVWDVWQAPAGQPLQQITGEKAAAWRDVLSWLQDLSQELDAAEKDHTLPSTLTLAQVWITADGRAMLLDAPWPGVSADEFADHHPQAFLHRVASLARSQERPLYSDALLTGLASRSFDRLSHIAGNVAHLLPRRFLVSRTGRVASLISPVLLPLLVIAGILLTYDAFLAARWSEPFPGLPPLPKVLKLYSETINEPQPEAREAIEKHLTAHYAHLQETDGTVKLPDGMYLKKAHMDGLRVALAKSAMTNSSTRTASPAPYDEKVNELIQSRFEPFYLRQVSFKDELAPTLLMILVGVATCQLAGILLIGSPWLMRLNSVAVVTVTQRPASRLRMLWRWYIGWAPVMLFIVFQTLLGHDPFLTLPLHAQYLLLALLLLSLIAFVPRRSLVDRLAGTWLVVR